MPQTAEDHRFATDADVASIGLRLLDRTLPKSEWTHAAHLSAAAWIILQRPDIDAEAELPEIIRAYNTATGVPNSDTRGYHETITMASLRAIRAIFAAQPTDAPMAWRVNELLASRLGRKDWLLDHWSEDLLMSAEARRRWVEPNRAALPLMKTPSPE